MDPLHFLEASTISDLCGLGQHLFRPCFSVTIFCKNAWTFLLSPCRRLKEFHLSADCPVAQFTKTRPSQLLPPGRPPRNNPIFPPPPSIPAILPFPRSFRFQHELYFPPFLFSLAVPPSDFFLLRMLFLFFSFLSILNFASLVVN